MISKQIGRDKEKLSNFNETSRASHLSLIQRLLRRFKKKKYFKDIGLDNESGDD